MYELFLDDSSYSVTLNSTETTKNDKNTFKDIIDSVINKMFSYFMWRNHINVLLPAKKTVNIPVTFNQNLANSSISECYVIVFDNTEFKIPNQVKFSKEITAMSRIMCLK